MNGLQKFIARLVGVKAFDYRGQYTIQNGRLVSISDNTENYIKKGYNINDIVYSVVNVQTDKVKVAPWGLFKVVDDSSLKKYYAITSKKEMNADDIVRAKEYRKKALEPVTKDSKWKRLLDRPNNEGTFQDLVAKACGWRLLTGNTYLWADILEGGAERGMPQSLHLMPSQHVKILAIDSFPGKVTGYDLTALGIKTKGVYAPEEVLHVKSSNFDFNSSGDQFYGMSPLKAALRIINRNNSALDASTAKFQNGGLDSVIYNDNPDMPIEVAIEQAQSLKLKLAKEYTGPHNQGKIASSPYKVGVATLGLSPVDLQIIESEKFDLVRIASIYAVPPELVGHTGTKTYDNIKTAEKALTLRCAIPHLSDFRNGLNRHAHEYWGLDRGIIIDYDTTVYSELEENMVEKMSWIEKVADLTGIPVNDILELAGLETMDVPEFDEPRITDKMGRFISEYRNNAVDDVLNEEENDR